VRRDVDSDRWQTGNEALLIRSLQHGRNDALANVVLVAPRTGVRRERWVVGGDVVASRQVARHLVREPASHVDVAHPRVGLAVADVELAVCEVDPDVERCGLGRTQASTSEGGDESTPSVFGDRGRESRWRSRSSRTRRRRSGV
jgi:hypothetical protein